MSLPVSKMLAPRELTQLLDNPSLAASIKCVDATWHMPNSSLPQPSLEFQKIRLPRARFFDIDGICDRTSIYPHMLPDARTFQLSMNQLNIQRTDNLAVYDTVGGFSCFRAGWMLRGFGHEGRVWILRNYLDYVKEGRAMESLNTLTPVSETGDYGLKEFDSDMVISYENLLMLVEDKKVGLSSGQTVVIDARSYGRFTGESPEPRPGISSGHVPGAVSVQFNELLEDKTNKMLPSEELKKVFELRGIDTTRTDLDIVAMCGTGVTACVVETALRVLEVQGRVRVYDGSWTEWAMRDGPIEKSV
ncbi:3-mercaptopyruvate sulfurtransferase [Nadsonia fulvescens var. elongata DSM 6958]|uniref:Sulfurtransferase n=1 Tax=Nadsonia fulvescens var. elongata DSM 6958 TaxID=857566 RepID=A0A1E3PE51_9ASCO|nr:3-mercaptopyruvate sulfurtransferase [Nadsonia fulvescens var. elongata DSM 6958]